MRQVKRRLGRSPPSKFDKGDPNVKDIIATPEVEQVFPPPNHRVTDEDEVITAFTRQNPFSPSKAHRCTYYRPSNEDFGQLTDMVLPPEDYYQNLLQEVCRDSNIPDTTKTKEMKNACQGSTIQTCSRFVEPAVALGSEEDNMAELSSDEAQWQPIDSISDVDKFLNNTETEKVTQSAKNLLPSFPNNICISETPRVKRIAEKYSKFKRNNIELRKLEERIVCLEYDIFDLNSDDPAVPMQIMRAFFSIKMKENGGSTNKDNITCIPSGVKRNFNIEDGDLQKLDRKEIEIIDEEIAENRSIIEDLKRVLRRKQALENKKKQQTLDLMYLYEMAKRESPPLDNDYSNTNLLSKAELQEIKDLILKKCASSSVHGINRKTVKCTQGSANCVISNSLINELLREGKKA